MASEQITMSETIAKAVLVATRAAIQAMAAAVAERPQSMAGPKIGGPATKQPTFNWETEDRYSKLNNFRLEINNILSMNNTPQAEQLVMVKNWFGRRGLQFLETLTVEEKTICRPLEGLFETLSNKFKLQYNETIKSLQFQKLCRKDGKNTEEWMGRLWLTAVECNYQELDRQLKEQFIHGLNDKEMLGEKIKELTTTKGNDTITSENMLLWMKRVEAQRAQSAVMNTITETAEFDKIRMSNMPAKTAPEGQHSLAHHQNRYAGVW